MNDADLKMIEEREKAASTGDWQVRNRLHSNKGTCFIVTPPIPDLHADPLGTTYRRICVLDPSLYMSEDMCYKNALFIAHAKADVPEMLKEVHFLNSILADACDDKRVVKRLLKMRKGLEEAHRHATGHDMKIRLAKILREDDEINRT